MQPEHMDEGMVRRIEANRAFLASLLWYAGLLGIATFFLEHVGRKNNVPLMRPTTYFNAIHAILAPIVRKIGFFVADVLAFLDIIDMTEFLQTATELRDASFKLGFVWVDGINGMVARLGQYNELVVLASITLLVFLMLGINAYGWTVSVQAMFVATAVGMITNVVYKWNAKLAFVDVVVEVETAEEEPPRRRKRRTPARNALMY